MMKLKAGIHSSLHTTSIYVLYLVNLLLQGPQRLSEMQQALGREFHEDCPPSSDSVRLYLKTLEALGCELEKPCAKNHHHFALRYHPFAFAPNTQEWHVLCERFEQHLNTCDVAQFLQFYELAYTLSQQCFLSSHQKHTLLEVISGFLRPALLPIMKDLVKARRASAIYFVNYQSATSNYEWLLLHKRIVIMENRLYWLCYRVNEGREELSPMMLRMDRFRSIYRMQGGQQLEQDLLTLQQQLLKQASTSKQFSCVLVLPKGVIFQGPSISTESVEMLSPSECEALPLQQEMQALYETETYALRYRAKTLHEFYLAQHLKASGAFIIPLNPETQALFEDPSESKLQPHEMALGGKPL